MQRARTSALPPPDHGRERSRYGAYGAKRTQPLVLLDGVAVSIHGREAGTRKLAELMAGRAVFENSWRPALSEFAPDILHR